MDWKTVVCVSANIVILFAGLLFLLTLGLPLWALGMIGLWIWRRWRRHTSDATSASIQQLSTHHAESHEGNTMTQPQEVPGAPPGPVEPVQSPGGLQEFATFFAALDEHAARHSAVFSRKEARRLHFLYLRRPIPVQSGENEVSE